MSVRCCYIVYILIIKGGIVMNENDQAMTIKKVAGFLNISNQMVYNLVKDGSLKAFKIGSASRIMYSDLRGYIEKQKEEFAMNHVEPHPDENDFTVNNLSLRKGEFKISDVNFFKVCLVLFHTYCFNIHKFLYAIMRKFPAKTAFLNAAKR